MKVRAHTCKRCGAAIVWMQTFRGHWMPVNAAEGLKDRQLFLAASDKMVPHWATCPHAIEFRREKEAAKARAAASPTAVQPDRGRQTDLPLEGGRGSEPADSGPSVQPRPDSGPEGA